MFNVAAGSQLGDLFTTFFISMVPVAELRVGLPFGIAHGLPFWLAYGAAVLGNMVPVPLIVLFLRRLFLWMRKYEKVAVFVEKMEKRAHLKGQKVKKYEAFGLFLLVAIPLPGTGAWTGALVASVFDMRLKRAFPIILLGVMAAGLIMTALTYGIATIFQ